MSQLSSLLTEINTELGTPITRTMLIAALRDLANVSSSSSMTKADAEAYTFTNPPEILHTAGWANPSDFGGAAYQKVDTFTTPVNGLGNHVGTFTTVDGTKYQMIPTKAEVYVNAFGATSHAQGDFSFDNWQAFEDCKYWIKGLADANNLNGMDMRISPGCFYLTKAHSIEGGAYQMIGSGRNATMLRFAWDQDGIQVQCGFSPGCTIGHEGGNLNAGATYSLGMIGYWPGTTRVYRCTTAGTLGTSAPVGTGTGITTPGGTAVWAYLRERTYSENNINGGGGSVISDMSLWGRFDRLDPLQNGRDEDQTRVDGGYHSGIVMRERATVERVFVASFVGHGIAIVASGDLEIRGGGNADQWRLDRVSSYWNGHDGIHVGVGIANAGLGIDLDTAGNLRYGIKDCTLLGNRFLSVQSAFDGTSGSGAPYPGMCTHNGYIWLARVPGVGGDPLANYSNEPGTDPNSWFRIRGDGQAAPFVDWPLWNNTMKFVPAGAFCSDNINQRTQWYGTYIEGGTNPPQFALQNSIWGGIGTGSSGHGEQVYDDSGTFNRTVKVSAQFGGADGKDGFTARFGPSTIDGGSQTFADSTIFGFQGAGNECVLSGAMDNAQTITGSIADVVASSASFHGQIGVGDAGGNNVWSNILFVRSVESGTVLPGQTISGPGIVAGTTIGNPSWWTDSYEILPGDGVRIGTDGTGAGGITNEAMTSQRVLPIMTVTACPPDGISLGATLQGASLPWPNGGIVQIAKQLDPTTLANVPFTGGTGKYALSRAGNTIASTTFTVHPNGMHNIDFGLSKLSDAGTHVWGWTGSDSKRKFGRINPIKDTFYARQMILGAGQRGMDDGKSFVVSYSNGTPDNAGDYATHEIKFNAHITAAGQPWGWMFLGTDTGITGTPKWAPLGTIS